MPTSAQEVCPLCAAKLRINYKTRKFFPDFMSKPFIVRPLTCINTHIICPMCIPPAQR